MLSVDFFVTLALLILLQAVLGFDNLLYISLESKRVPPDRQAFVRRMGIGLAVGLRIILLFFVVTLVEKFKEPLFALNLGAEVTPAEAHGDHPKPVNNIVDGEFNLHSLIVLLGGVFILYTATKEVLHMMTLEEQAAFTMKTSQTCLAGQDDHLLDRRHEC